MDCVFGKLMADPAGTDRLLDFLNAVLQRDPPVVDVRIQNPTHFPDFVGDDHTVVDVKATDARGETFHVEMQSWNHVALKERMVYAWADLYEGQLVAGAGYPALRPVVSIWILDKNAIRNAGHYHHRFGIWDPDRRVRLTTHFDLHLLELARWREHPDADAPPGLLRWLRFFSEAESWSAVPAEIDHPALESAMSVLHEFQANRDWNDAYRTRLDALRVKITMDEEMAATQAAMAQTQAAMAQTQAAMAAAQTALAAAQEQRERAQAETERAQAEAERAQAEAERAQAETERAQAEAERAQAEAERARAEKERERVAREQAQAREQRLRERLRALGVEPEE